MHKMHIAIFVAVGVHFSTAYIDAIKKTSEAVMVTTSIILKLLKLILKNSKTKKITTVKEIWISSDFEKIFLRFYFSV